MARTIRAGGVADGKAVTMRGLDRCPPRAFRKAEATRPERREGSTLARLARLFGGDDALPAFGRVAMPWFT
jgi:hypothetical protein